MKKLNTESFKRIILRGDNSIIASNLNSTISFTLGSDRFFQILKDSNHQKISLRLNEIIFSKQKTNSCSVGFKKNYSYLDFLSAHIDGYYFLRLDIVKFFHSITQSDIKDLLSNFFEKGENDETSPLNIAMAAVLYKLPEDGEDKLLKGRRFLPIGYPTSPNISNLIFRKIDILIQKYCENKNIKYTRYADDLLFSSKSSNFLHSEIFEREIAVYLNILLLKINKKKIIKSENTISLNGYTIQNKRPTKKSDFFSEKYHIGAIRLSNKKLNKIKKLIYFLRCGKPPYFIMNKLFKNTRRKEKIQDFTLDFQLKFYKDQLRNKIIGYRSYMIFFIKYNEKNKCIHEKDIKKYKDILLKLEKYI